MESTKPDPEIQNAFEKYRTIVLNQRTVELQIFYSNNFDRAVEWLDQCLTDNVRTIRLNFTFCEYSTAHETALYEFARSKTKLKEIIVYFTAHSITVIITFTKKQSNITITTKYMTGIEEFFHDYIPQDIQDTLSKNNNSGENTAQYFRTITAEKDSPNSPSKIIGLYLTYGVMYTQENYIEYLSKLPNLKELQYNWEPDDHMKKFNQHMLNNATNLQEISVRGNFSERMLESTNELITARNNTLKALYILKEIRPSKYVDHSFELTALAQNRSIKKLMLDFYSGQIKNFIEPLRQNQTISSLTIKLSIGVIGTFDSAIDLMQVIATKTCLRNLMLGISRYGDSDEMPKTISIALENKNITSLDLLWVDLNNDQIINTILTNPNLTRLKITKGDIPQVLQHHIASNKRNRDEKRIGLITILFNIARSSELATPYYLPKEVWRIIMSYIEYPGIDQPFGDILRELIVNSEIRRVIVD